MKSACYKNSTAKIKTLLRFKLKLLFNIPRNQQQVYLMFDLILINFANLKINAIQCVKCAIKV